jgi:hypothetical protein
VKPTNLKLIDRAIRYVQALSGARYPTAAAAVFAVMPGLTADRSVVTSAVEWLAARQEKPWPGRAPSERPMQPPPDPEKQER